MDWFSGSLNSRVRATAPSTCTLCLRERMHWVPPPRGKPFPCPHEPWTTEASDAYSRLVPVHKPHPPAELPTMILRPVERKKERKDGRGRRRREDGVGMREILRRRKNGIDEAMKVLNEEIQTTRKISRLEFLRRTKEREKEDAKAEKFSGDNKKGDCPKRREFNINPTSLNMPWTKKWYELNKDSYWRKRHLAMWPKPNRYAHPKKDYEMWFRYPEIKSHSVTGSCFQPPGCST